MVASGEPWSQKLCCGVRCLEIYVVADPYVVMIVSKDTRF